MLKSQPVLTCTQVTKQFGNTPPAVNQVSFSLQAGELVGLLGPSGCGKTTLLRLVAGFECPEVGEIVLAGQSVCGGHGGAHHWLPPERRQVGVVFQDYALFPHLSVLENVAFGLKQLTRRGQLPKQQINQLAREAINLVGLSGMEGRYSHELSGGQQQRVALARALAPRPPLILLDEPFSNLDVQVRLYLRQEVRDILKSIGASGIFVTHDQEEALAIADRVAVMENGHLIQIDTPEQIYQQPASRFVAEFVTQANFVSAIRNGLNWETELGPIMDASVTVNHNQANHNQLESEQTEPAQTDLEATDSEQTELEPAAPNQTDSEQGELMICQEDLQIEPDATGILEISGRQFLGREYQYALKLPSSKMLQVRTGANQRLAIGEQVSVRVKGDRVRFFPSQKAVQKASQRGNHQGVTQGAMTRLTSSTLKNREPSKV